MFQLRLMRALIILGGALLLAAPSAALAHDELGGDELAAANWMLIAAMVTIVMGLVAAIWAWRSGQFSNIEESKYNMLRTSEDYDAVLAEADARRAAAKATEQAGEAKAQG